MKRFAPLLLLTLSLFLLVPMTTHAQGDGWLVASRRTEGQSDLWAMPANGGAWQRLTRTPDDERFPAWSADGSRLAYAARRDRNWDIYSLDLRTGKETRLTTNPHFDSYPAWSPDGTRLAFASTREGEYDLFVLNLATGQETNLTPTSTAHDFEPRWEDNDTILFVSTRDKSHDIFRLRLGEEAPTPITNTPSIGERDIMPLEDSLLVVTQNDRLHYLQRLSKNGSPFGAPISWTNTVATAAVSPDGQGVVFLEQRADGAVLYRTTITGDNFQELSGPIPFMESVSWGVPQAAWMEAQLQAPPAILLPAAPTVKPSELVWLNDVDSLQPQLNRDVLASFQTLRGHLAGELGYDFLGELSEAWRPIDWQSDDSDYLSWHKAGRAFDTLLDAGLVGGYPELEQVREDWHGDVIWQLWIRCTAQDGTCGEPLVDTPWNFSYEARWDVAPGQGGIPKLFQAGYYVNFTRYAEDGGWERITSYETPTFDWRDDKIGTEFWHYQRLDGLNWYQAIQEIISPSEMDEYFSYRTLQELAVPRWKMVVKGFPLPRELRDVPAAIVIP